MSPEKQGRRMEALLRRCRECHQPPQTPAQGPLAVRRWRAMLSRDVPVAVAIFAGRGVERRERREGNDMSTPPIPRLLDTDKAVPGEAEPTNKRGSPSARSAPLSTVATQRVCSHARTGRQHGGILRLRFYSSPASFGRRREAIQAAKHRILLSYHKKFKAIAGHSRLFYLLFCRRVSGSRRTTDDGPPSRFRRSNGRSAGEQTATTSLLKQLATMAEGVDLGRNKDGTPASGSTLNSSGKMSIFTPARWWRNEVLPSGKAQRKQKVAALRNGRRREKSRWLFRCSVLCLRNSGEGATRGSPSFVLLAGGERLPPEATIARAAWSYCVASTHNYRHCRNHGSKLHPSPKDNREGENTWLLGWEVAIGQAPVPPSPHIAEESTGSCMSASEQGGLWRRRQRGGGESTTPSSATVVRFLPEHPQLCLPPPKPLPEPREGIVALAPSRHASTTAGVVRRRCWLPGIVRS
nr:hypothetical protein Iba_chr13fCG9700 [Ipomoea batatas]